MSRSTAQAEEGGIHNPIPEPGLPTWPKPSLNKARRLVWAAAPSLGSSALRSLKAWRWCCADPNEPVDMISGITRLVGACSRRDRGCPPAYTRPGGTDTATGSSATSLAAPTWEWETRSLHKSGNAPRCQCPSSAPQGGGGWITELTLAHLKYTITAQVTWGARSSMEQDHR